MKSMLHPLFLAVFITIFGIAHAQKRPILSVQGSAGANLQSAYSVTGTHSRVGFGFGSQVQLGLSLKWKGWEVGAGGGHFVTRLTVKPGSYISPWSDYKPVRAPFAFWTFGGFLRRELRCGGRWTPFVQVGAAILWETHEGSYRNWDSDGALRAKESNAKPGSYRFHLQGSGAHVPFVMHGAVGIVRPVAGRLSIAPYVQFNIGGAIANSGTLVVQQEDTGMHSEGTYAFTSASGIGLHLAVQYALW